MVDVRDSLEGVAPTAHPLDMDDVRRRAAAIAAADQRRHRRRFASVATVLVLALVIAVPTLTRDGELSMLAGGTGLPGIAGPSVTGEGEVALADFAGEPLLVHGWAPWCDICIQTWLPDLAAYAERDDAVQVVTAVIASDQETAAAAYVDAGLDVPTMMLPDTGELRSLLPAEVASQGPLDAVPVTLAFNAAGMLVQVRIGGPQPDGPSLSWTPDIWYQGLAAIARTAVEYTPYGSIGAQATPPPSAGPFPTPTGVPTESGHCDALPARSGPRLYEVQAGDTLSTIAQAVYGDSTFFGAIAAANDLHGDRALCIGEMLLIPDNPGAPSEANEGDPALAGPDFDPQLADRLRDNFLTSLTQGPQARITPSTEYQNPWVVFTGTDESGALVVAHLYSSSLEEAVADTVHGGCPPLTTTFVEGCGQELAEINGRRTAVILFADTLFQVLVEAPSGHVLNVFLSQQPGPDSATALTPQETIDWLSTIDALVTS